ncbi:hypothetical protein [Chryseobacterium sp.]|uniref:hypothetical protein n=1 Tax=Chryseobacterium sp. TaxID=1871047 RepID=UPI0028A0E7C4|nr:hypothetical protein [Chryseobacterium sp.]
MSEQKTHDDKVRKEELDKAIKDALDPLTEGQKKTGEDVASIVEDVNVIKEAMKSKVSPEFKGFLHTVIKENHEEIVKNFKEKGSKEFLIEKVPAMHMTNNGTISNTAGLTLPTGPFEWDNEIAMIRIPENFILTVIRNTQRSKVPEYVMKRQQVPGEGAVAVVVEGEVKPLLQYKFQNTSTKRKKYAGRIEWTEEFEMDFEALLDAIIDMIERDVLTAWQDGIIEIIEANATSYIGSSLDATLPNPDNGLAIIAAMQQIRVLGFTPETVLMNPVDIDAAIYTQDANGNLQLKPYIDASGNRIAGVRVVPSLKIEAGQAIIGEFSIYKEIHSGFIFRRGQYNEQFIENEYTAVGEVFSILNAAPAEYPGIVKINLATVKAALKAA